MKQLTSFTTGAIVALSLAIIMSLPEYEAPDPAPDYGYNEPQYRIEKIDGGYCADRVIRRGHTYISTYCAGEFGKIPINIPHTSSPE